VDEEASLNEVRNEPIATESQVSVSNEETIKCGQCERPFKHGDYVYIVEALKKIICRTCFGIGKGYKARVCLFTTVESSSVARDRLARRAKKLQRLSKKQGYRCAPTANAATQASYRTWSSITSQR